MQVRRPRAGYATRRLAFWLQPYSFFDGDASGNLLEAVTVTPSGPGRLATPVVAPGGIQSNFSCVPQETRPAYLARELQSL